MISFSAKVLNNLPGSVIVRNGLRCLGSVPSNLPMKLYGCPDADWYLVFSVLIVQMLGVEH